VQPAAERLSELQNQMDRSRISLRSVPEAEFSEHFEHRGVLGQNFRRQFLQSGIPGDLDEMTHQHRADPASLPGIDDDERHLGPSGLKNNVTTAPDDNRTAIFRRECNKGDMILEVNIHKEIALFLREVALHRKEATLK
jgi:hypothetical protein